MTNDQTAWMTHPDILDIRRYVGDIFQREEHTAARTFAELTVGVHHDRRRDETDAAYHDAINAACGKLDNALRREAIR